MEASPVHLCATPKRVILGAVNAQNNGSPISPMANLKLLTKVATSHVSMDEKTQEYIILSPNKKAPVKFTRHLRSLSYICKKFLDFYNLEMPPGKHKPLSLGQVTILLGIEKRRVYDIINIVASLKFATKVCKDKYLWYGNQFLVSTLCEIRAYAFAHNYHIRLQQMSQNNNNNCDNSVVNISSADTQFDNLENVKSKNKGLFDDNRMGALCQKCMMLFLVAPKGEALNFKIISSVILPQNVPNKNGMRRLYDISHILEKLGLITRVENKHLKKPSFVYSGPDLPEQYSRPLETPMLPELESSSDSNSEFCEMKFQDILEVVCTELDNKDSPKGNRLTGTMPNAYNSFSAKKKLFPDDNMKSSRGSPCESTGFVKAPSTSFRWSSSGIVKIPDHTYGMSQKTQKDSSQFFNPLQPKVSSSVSTTNIININSIAKNAPEGEFINFSKPMSQTNMVNSIARPIPSFDSKLANTNFNSNNFYSTELVSNTIDVETTELISNFSESNMTSECVKKTVLPTKLKFSSPPLQNGGLYKVHKEGNVIHFVKLE